MLSIKLNIISINSVTLLLFFAIYVDGFAQKTHTFDHVLEYEFQLNEDAETQTQLFFTNSKDNSYLLKVFEKDSTNFKMHFEHYDSIISSDITVRKKDFYMAETVSIRCGSLNSRSNPYKKSAKKIDFTNLKDTIIDNIFYHHYQARSNEYKREKRKKLATAHYIIDKETENHLPVIRFGNLYERWLQTRNIPNGVFKEKYYISYTTKKKGLIYRLKRMEKTKKYIQIKEGCNVKRMHLILRKP